MKKFSIITSTRADYSLLKNLILQLKKKKKFKLKLVITGSHLSRKYGKTINEINNLTNINKAKIDIKIKSSSEANMSYSFSLGVKKFTHYLKRNKTDLVILLGDRYEIFAFAIACMISRVPIAHIHGGEITQNSIDEAIRHSITKISHIHFVANNIYKKRVLQLGEAKKNVFNVGGLGAYNLSKEKFFKKKEILKKIGVKKINNYILVCFHPETLDKHKTIINFKKLLNVLKDFKDQFFLFTMSNADQDSDYIYFEIQNFVSKFSNAKFIKSIGNKYYYSFLKHSDLIVGNSSSGILEAPSAKTPTLNVGDRQKGRIVAKSVINCDFNEQNIKRKLNFILKNKKKFSFKNPYYYGNTPLKIVKVLEKINLKKLLKKEFKDINL